mmetsp:Transcript_19898/g.76246  ORF Transcript_19898/g.76246 Transcript_19898/m.76246 type:complete len:225 (+) Transcript_19898:599-1273(+)
MGRSGEGVLSIVSEVDPPDETEEEELEGRGGPLAGEVCEREATDSPGEDMERSIEAHGERRHGHASLLAGHHAGSVAAACHQHPLFLCLSVGANVLHVHPLHSPHSLHSLARPALPPELLQRCPCRPPTTTLVTSGDNDREISPGALLALHMHEPLSLVLSLCHWRNAFHFSREFCPIREGEITPVVLEVDNHLTAGGKVTVSATDSVIAERKVRELESFPREH